MEQQFELRHLISDEYLLQNRELHDAPKGFGGSGYKHAEAVAKFANEIGAKTILDYGCGESTLKKALTDMAISQAVYEWDPAIIKKSRRLPVAADLVVCTDVLEHVEPDRLMNVLGHLHQLTLRGCFLVIATRPANKLMPDGSNAHKIIEDTPFWIERVQQLKWKVVQMLDKRKGDNQPHEVRLWLRR